MDGSFTIKPNAAVPKFTPRDRSEFLSALDRAIVRIKRKNAAS